MKRINRFLSSLLIVPAFIGCAETGIQPSDTGIGLQLYSVRDLMSGYERGDLSLFKDLAGMGFDYVEAHGYADGKFFGKSPSQFKQDMAAVGLSVPSSHFSLALTPEQLESGDFSEALVQWDKAIAAHVEAGIGNILMAWIQFPPETSDAWKVYADYLNTVGKKCKAAGLDFGYHNHAFEFKTCADGALPYDLLLQNTDPKLVFFELDTYWMSSMGQKPADWVARYPGRFKMMHIKDDDVIGASGKMNFEEILALKEQAGTQYAILEIEQYGSEQILGAISKSIVNWTAILDSANACAPAEETVCTLEIYDTESKTRSTVATFDKTIEAPNWTPDGQWLIFNSGGLLYRIAADGSTEAEKIETGSVTRCNNDHCLTFDGKQIGISSGSKDDRRSHIYVCPAAGGTPETVVALYGGQGTINVNSWAPDSKRFAFVSFVKKQK